LLIKKKKSLFKVKPLKPKELKNITIKLGASFIKLAQVLATRADFFENDYLEELKNLHDQLPPMKDVEFKKVFAMAFKDNSFISFENSPIASASIGQVHIAYLNSNQKVAVKLRRKGIKEQVIADIRILNFFNRLFTPFFSFYTKNSIDTLILEFSEMIIKEVSLKNELSNLQKFSQIYSKSGIKFPTPYIELCSDDAIVMSFEDGFRFDDKINLEKFNINFKELITKLVDFYTLQMLINGYFHADPHPGNLLVNSKGELILLDFGMVKRVPNHIRVAIIELIKSANERDYETYIMANKKLGTISYEAPNSLLAEFSEKMFDIFSNENLSSESMQKLAFEVLESTKNLPFKLPSDAVYILRVSAIIEGLGTTYIKNFNGVKDILPILQNSIPKALGAKDTIFETIYEELKELPFSVKNLKTFLHIASSGELEIQLSKYQLEFLKKEFKDYLKPIFGSFALILFSIFLILYDKNLENLALIIAFIGIFRLFWK